MMRELPTAATLDRLECEWPVDPKADALVAEMFEEHGLEAVSGLLQTLVDNDSVKHLSAETTSLSPRLLADVQDYLDDVGKLRLPAWADPERIDRSVNLFMQHGLASYMVLACSSLSECYLSRDIAMVLGATHRLDNDGHRRLIETSQFVLEVMKPGGLTSPTGDGLLVIHKVRLIHATVRHLVRERAQHQHQAHDRDHLGHRLAHRLAAGTYSERSPNNQTLLALTLQTFGYVILRGLNTLDVELTDEQQGDFIHTWSVVGHFLGIQDDLLPSDFAQARDLFELLKARQRAATPDGELLQASLLKYAAKLLPWYLRRLPRHLTCDLMSEADCAALGIKQPNWLGRLINAIPLWLARRLNRRYRILSRLDPSVQDTWEYLARRLLGRISSLPPSDQGRVYALPDHLYRWPDEPQTADRVADSA